MLREISARIPTTSTVIFGAAALVLIGAVVVALRSPAPPTPSANPASTVERDAGGWRQEVARLEDAVEHERTERTALTAEIRELREQMEAIEARAERIAVAVRRAAASEGASPAPAAGSATAADDATKRPGIDTEAIVDAGFERAEVEAFRSRMDHIELERLYLRDLASREDWLDTPRFRQENGELANAYEAARDEFSEELYDWMRYASGQPNRMQVGEVMAGSAAADAGLEAGDVILRYDDQRIFGFPELRDATRAGTAGDPTTVDIVRNGREIQVTLPRGPLGVRLVPLSEEPPPAR